MMSRQLRLLALLALGRKPPNAKADSDVAWVACKAKAPVRGPAAVGAVGPVAAPAQACGAVFVKQILAPLGGVSMHVVQPQPIRLIGANLAGPPQAIIVEIGLLNGQCL